MTSRRLVGPCSLFGCGTPIYSKYLCEKHYRRWRRHGDPTVTKQKKFVHHPEHVKPRMGPRSFYGPCSEFGCGKVGMKNGKCTRHNRLAKAESDARPMLSQDEIRQIQMTRTANAQQLAEQFSTTPRTVVAVQAGRNWGYRTA